MTEAELIFTPLAELSTRQIAETEQAKGLLKNARKELKSKTGKNVVTGENFLPPSKKIKALTPLNKKKK